MSTPSSPSATGFKGRGSAERMAHRYQHVLSEPFDDGWTTADVDPVAVPVTELRWEDPRSAISYNQSPDIGFDRSINPITDCP